MSYSIESSEKDATKKKQYSMKSRYNLVQDEEIKNKQNENKITTIIVATRVIIYLIIIIIDRTDKADSVITTFRMRGLDQT